MVASRSAFSVQRSVLHTSNPKSIIAVTIKPSELQVRASVSNELNKSYHRFFGVGHGLVFIDFSSSISSSIKLSISSPPAPISGFMPVLRKTCRVPCRNFRVESTITITVTTTAPSPRSSLVFLLITSYPPYPSYPYHIPRGPTHENLPSLEY